MNKLKILIFLFFSITISSSYAQVCGVFTDVYGNSLIQVHLGDGDYALIDEYGDIKRLDTGKEVEFYSDFHDYESGKLKKVGDIDFKYYSDFHDYNSGKIKAIRRTKFEYYSDFQDYEAGKLKSVGDVEFTYYSGFRDYEKGKIKSIGESKYEYYSEDSQKRGMLKKGKLKYITDNIEFRIKIRRPF